MVQDVVELSEALVSVDSVSRNSNARLQVSASIDQKSHHLGDPAAVNCSYQRRLSVVVARLQVSACVDCCSNRVRVPFSNEIKEAL